MFVSLPGHSGDVGSLCKELPEDYKILLAMHPSFLLIRIIILVMIRVILMFSLYVCMQREKRNLQDLNGVYVFNVAERDYLDRPTARLIKEIGNVEGMSLVK